MTIIIESQGFSTDQLIDLYEIDLTHIDAGAILRFTGGYLAGVSVVFDGDTYGAIDFDAEGFEYSGGGTLPRPLLRISNVTSAATSLNLQFDDLLGAKVTRTRTFVKFLDGQPEADPTQFFPKEIYYVDMKKTQNNIYAEWELASSLDQEGRKLPARQVIKTSCTHIYRAFDSTTGLFDYTKATCPYTDTPSFDQGGTATGSSDDVCGKKLTDCKLRFGEDGELPTRAFPGVGATS
tara:strand:+ start:5253 stop:5960 length:708 start_codon:yes stop_codon:yes gene_type:complete